jgi:hypothetical protein
MAVEKPSRAMHDGGELLWMKADAREASVGVTLRWMQASCSQRP